MRPAIQVVMARKEPRKLLIQPHMHSTEAGDGVVSHHLGCILLKMPKCRCGQALQTFEESTAGMVESFVARFPPEDPELYALYEAEKAQVTD